MVTDGLTRDAAQILTMDFPVFAAGFSPLDSKGRLDGNSYGQPIRIGTCLVRPGDWIFGDDDGVVAIPRHMVETVLEVAETIRRKENEVTERVLAGENMADILGFHRFLDGTDVSISVLSEPER